MTKNLIPIIAKELGVVLHEEFGVCTSKYKFCNNDLLKFNPETEFWELCRDNTLYDIANGKASIKKLPFIPKDGDKYFYYCSNFRVDFSFWNNLPFEIALLKCGCVFRTEAEAFAYRPIRYEEFTGKKWEK